MHIREITIQEFERFVETHPLGSHYQSINYAILMVENGFDYEFIGYVDEYNKIYAASLILIKKLNKLFQYGYAPKGFLLDYFNKTLLKNFSDDLICYYKKRNLVFIKINPEIAVAEINNKNFQKIYNQNIEIQNNLMDAGYKKLKENLYFESMLPRYNAIVNLKNFHDNTLLKNTRNKVKRAKEKGLCIEIANRSGIDILYPFIKRKRNKDSLYYKDYYNVFFKSNNVDLFLVSIDTNSYLINAKKAYENELKENSNFANLLRNKNTEKNLHLKINSDIKLSAYKKDLIEARNISLMASKIYIAGALVVKYKNRITIVMSGYDTNYKHFNPNYFLHYEILNYYKNYYHYADLNGITGDFTHTNPYKGLTHFKLGFNPKVYEFIGEYDLIIKERIYNILLKSGTLAKVFNKRDRKIK